MGGKWAKPVSKGKKLGGIFAAQLGKLIRDYAAARGPCP